jgi:clan AA aspartic protease
MNGGVSVSFVDGPLAALRRPTLATMISRPARLRTRRSTRMGVSYVVATLRHPSRRGGSLRVRCLVDTGAIFTVLPPHVWQKLRLEPLEAAEFTLADGTVVRRRVSEARFTIEGRSRTSPVVLGEAGEAALLGAVTLETLGLMVNPLSRRVLPMRMILA